MANSQLAKGAVPVSRTSAGQDKHGPRFNYNTGQQVPIDMFIVHHAAGTFAGLKAAFANPEREVSANYAIDNDGGIWVGTAEHLRSFCSASWKADTRGVTVEVVNSATGDASGWPVSDAAFHALARLIADVATRNGFPVDRRHVIMHNEVVGIFGQGYVTACPGGLSARMDELCALARHYQASGNLPATQEEDEDMAKNVGFWFPTKTMGNANLVVNTESGYADLFYSNEGGYNSRVATAYDTGSFQKISESHAKVIMAAAAAVREGNAAAVAELAAAVAKVTAALEARK